MHGLTSLGVIHTIISLIAVGAAIIALARDHQLVASNRVGRVYMVATVLTCLTGLPIFQHGGFGPPHALAIITLVVLAIVWAAAKTGVFGSWSRYVEVLGLSLTVFFHWVPAVTETSSRLPFDAPLTTGPNDPRVQAAVAFGFVLFLVGAFLQWRTLRAGADFAKRTIDIDGARSG
jgi:uncharacterized membrane protein